jgi:hypothetical protein
MNSGKRYRFKNKIAAVQGVNIIKQGSIFCSKLFLHKEYNQSNSSLFVLPECKVIILFFTAFLPGTVSVNKKKIKN